MVTLQIALVVCVNIALYGTFSLLLFSLARLVPVPRFLRDQSLVKPEAVSEEALPWWEEKKLFDVETTIALLFCGAAKGELCLLLNFDSTRKLTARATGIVLGGPMVQILYGGLSSVEAGIVVIPVRPFRIPQICAMPVADVFFTSSAAARPLPRQSGRRRPAHRRDPARLVAPRQGEERSLARLVSLSSTSHLAG